MGKITKKKPPEGWTEDTDLAEKVQPDVYQKYVKEHARKLRRAARELSGDNMNSPPEANYD